MTGNNITVDAAIDLLLECERRRFGDLNGPNLEALYGLRNARWSLMAARAAVFPSKGVGEVRGTANGMDEYLASIQ